jgi:hypothetical protein
MLGNLPYSASRVFTSKAMSAGVASASDAGHGSEKALPFKVAEGTAYIGDAATRRKKRGEGSSKLA